MDFFTYPLLFFHFEIEILTNSFFVPENDFNKESECRLSISKTKFERALSWVN